MTAQPGDRWRCSGDGRIVTIRTVDTVEDREFWTVLTDGELTPWLVPADHLNYDGSGWSPVLPPLITEPVTLVLVVGSSDTGRRFEMERFDGTADLIVGDYLLREVTS